MFLPLEPKKMRSMGGKCTLSALFPKFPNRKVLTANYEYNLRIDVYSQANWQLSNRYCSELIVAVLALFAYGALTRGAQDVQAR